MIRGKVPSRAYRAVLIALLILFSITLPQPAGAQPEEGDGPSVTVTLEDWDLRGQVSMMIRVYDYAQGFGASVGEEPDSNILGLPEFPGPQPQIVVNLPGTYLVAAGMNTQEYGLAGTAQVTVTFQYQASPASEPGPLATRSGAAKLDPELVGEGEEYEVGYLVFLPDENMVVLIDSTRKTIDLTTGEAIDTPEGVSIPGVVAGAPTGAGSGAEPEEASDRTTVSTVDDDVAVEDAVVDGEEEAAAGQTDGEQVATSSSSDEGGISRTGLVVAIILISFLLGLGSIGAGAWWDRNRGKSSNPAYAHDDPPTCVYQVEDLERAGFDTVKSSFDTEESPPPPPPPSHPPADPTKKEYYTHVAGSEPIKQVFSTTVAQVLTGQLVVPAGSDAQYVEGWSPEDKRGYKLAPGGTVTIVQQGNTETLVQLNSLKRPVWVDRACVRAQPPEPSDPSSPYGPPSPPSPSG